jgi:ABC-type transporter Mla subunit MlaD
MDDAIAKARAARNVLERLSAKAPAFSGYLERELFRDIGQLLRAHLADSLDASRASVAAYTRTVHLGAAETLERLSSIDKGLDALANAIRHAGSGYAGLFDAVKVNREQLEALYRSYLGLVEGVEAVAKEAGHLAESDDATDRLATAVANVRQDFEGNDKTIKGLFPG